MRDEYEFEYSQAKPNRFAAHMKRPVVAVVLEADVASVFDSSAKVKHPAPVDYCAAAIEVTVVGSSQASPQSGLTSAWSRRAHRPVIMSLRREAQAAR